MVHVSVFESTIKLHSDFNQVKGAKMRIENAVRDSENAMAKATKALDEAKDSSVGGSDWSGNSL